MIELYDATLRDGMQGPGMDLSAAEKVRVARALDTLGVGLIEAGFPASNPKEAELVEGVDDAHLLLGGEVHPLALHAVAECRVVKLDHQVTARAGTSTGSSHSR